MSGSCSASKAVVLTTHERSGYFTVVLGDDVDIRLDPVHEHTLSNLLHNVIVAGGDLAVIDDAFFINIDDMVTELQHFLSSEPHADRIKIILVCSHRKTGDPLLAYLVANCGVFNIIYNKNGVDVSIELKHLLQHENTWHDVQHLASSVSWDMYKSLSLKRNSDLSEVKKSSNEARAISPLVVHESKREMFIEVSSLKYLKLNIAIEGI